MAVPHSPIDISQMFCISQKTVKRYIQKFSLTGDIGPVCQRHRPLPLFESFEELTIF